MTYCVAALSDEGIVFASDSRTNAGIDHIASFAKMNVFETPGERLIVILTAGNLATTQSVVSLLKMRKDSAGKPSETGILGLRSLYHVAMLVGDTIREVMARGEEVFQRQQVDVSADFIVGGQIRGEPPRLFHIYPLGNYIEATADTTYFQIGETKYAKPVMDRMARFDSPLSELAKCALVSFDSTMRSNLSVGMPIDLLAYERDSLKITLRRRFCDGDRYFGEISNFWSAGLRQAFQELPEVTWAEAVEDCRKPRPIKAAPKAETS
jgi:putative proteasome-type protease